MKLLFDVALVEDSGSHWLVTNLQPMTFEQLKEKEETALPLSFMASKMIKDAVLNGKSVFITKHLMDREVHPGEFEILDPEQFDSIPMARKSALIKARMIVTPEITKYAGLALYSFIVLNNDLSQRGFFITNDNREEKYLEILETGDGELMQKLEDYLNYKDEIERVSHLERMLAAFKIEIDKSKTFEEIDSLLTEFLDKFYANY